MARRKQSLRLVKFSTAYPAKFLAWMNAELAGMVRWNPMQLRDSKPDSGYYIHRKVDGEILWEMQFYREHVSIESRQSLVHIRQGLCIDMGNGTVCVTGTQSQVTD